MIWKLLKKYQKPALIGSTVFLMAAVIFTAGEILYDGVKANKTIANLSPAGPLAKALPNDAGMFQNPGAWRTLPLDAGQTYKKRSVAAYYQRRAYRGAPPSIPHAIAADMADRMTCLNCHKYGAYVPAQKRYAPITPHPDFQNCTQCHLPQQTNALFRGTRWPTPTPPVPQPAALPGGPPPMPHLLQMRENCLACHGGPGALPEIRTPHPERIHCQQCHIAQKINE